MGFSQYPTITDELLSAYIDDAVNAAERAAVEEAAANDSEIAWRLESLQHTVSMLGQLTDVPLPRSFTLNEALVEAALVENHASSVGRPREAEAPDSLWNKWLDFWRSGSPIWRNAAAACALLLVVVLVGGSVVIQQPMSSQQSSELADARPADVRASFEQTAIANAPAVTDADSETASASVAMAPESASAPRDLAGPEQTNNVEASRLAEAPPMELAEDDSASAESQVESAIAADAATAGFALQEEQSASPEPLAAPSVADNKSMVADVESAPVSDPASPDIGGELAAGELAADAPDADQLIVASSMVIRTTIPSEGEGSEDTVAGNETVEKTAENAIAEPLSAQPLDDAAESLEAESMPEAAAMAAIDLAEPAATSVTDATEHPGADQESSGESAPQEAVMQASLDEEAPQDQDPQGGTDSVQPSTVAMADIAQDAEPAPEAVLEESSAPDPSAQLTTEETAALPLAGGVETAINSMSPLAMLAIVLAILALAFFAMWLRSRSTTATRSS